MRLIYILDTIGLFLRIFKKKYIYRCIRKQKKTHLISCVLDFFSQQGNFFFFLLMNVVTLSQSGLVQEELLFLQLIDYNYLHYND